MARYIDYERVPSAPVPEARILIRVVPSLVAGPVLAVMDTAAPWCIFVPEVGFTLRRSFEPVLRRTTLSTRLGVFHGSLYRIPLRLHADEGDSLDVEATVFLSPDWQGPNFIGYQGLLQRIRFAVDPETNLFYFGQI
jgi:hypothetical protein